LLVVANPQVLALIVSLPVVPGVLVVGKVQPISLATNLP
jgi:hypothetical protein